MIEFGDLSARTKVQVRELPILARVGVNRNEIGCRQPLIISVDLTLTVRTVDRLEETVDYEFVVNAAESLAQEHIPLIETFARRLGESFFRFGVVDAVDVRVDKPFALTKGLASVTISLARPAARSGSSLAPC